MDEALLIQTFEELPSPTDFASQIQSRNVPAVFKGCVKDWKAFSKWNPSNGGLDYLQDRVGLCAVESMLSRAAPVFYGDLGNHERVPLPFSSFIGFCKQQLQNTSDARGVCFELERDGLVGSIMEQSCPTDGGVCFELERDGLVGSIMEQSCPTDDPRQIYLAQVPIVNVEEEKAQLGTLKEDIQMPAILETKALASINLWMNSSKARSSTHYDPHHNLLRIVAGCKQAKVVVAMGRGRSTTRSNLYILNQKKLQQKHGFYLCFINTPDRDFPVKNKADLEMVTKLDPLRVYPYRYRAAELMDKRKEKEAIAELSRAIAFKADLHLLHLRAAFHEHNGDVSGELRDCRAVLSVDPNYQEMLELCSCVISHEPRR